MSRNGRARVSARDPQASAICDRCGTMTNHVDLRYQMEWAGRALINKRLLVCDRCLDVPNPQLRYVYTEPDPVPIRDPRPEPWSGPQPNPLTTDGGDALTADDGTPLYTENGA